MTIRRLAHSCDGGPCPTFHIDDQDGTVLVQGYLITNSPVPLPEGEDVVSIPADAWERLLTTLPPRMLLAALFGRLGRRAAATQPQYR